MRRMWVLPFVVAVICVLSLEGQQPTLYGVISQNPNQGFLITVNTTTGAATLIGNTGLTMPSGLTFDTKTGTLLAIDGYGGGRVSAIDVNSGVATPLQAPGTVPLPGDVAYRFVDDRLYTCMPGVNTCTLYQLDPATGANLGDVGVINKGPIGGLAVRPSDGVLFGSGFGNMTQNWFFTISTTPGPPPLETNVGQTSQMITALAFHPNGTLYASDATHLLTINPATGVATQIGSFGTNIGFVAGLAFATVPVAGPVDVWIKDCAADDGTVPSAPQHCPEWYKSTDIWIDNNDDMIIDSPVVGADNTLKAVVRNRQSGTAQNVSVKFYYRDNTTGLVFPDGASFIGQTSVTVPPNGIAVASVVWHNLPAPPATGGHWCIGVVLDHPNDPSIVPAVIPPNDNNVGIANIWFIASRAGEQVVLSFGAGSGGKGGFGLEPWPRDFVLKVDDRLPHGWTWTFEGIQADQPFSLKRGEERPVRLQIRPPTDAAAHSGGSFAVRQVDVTTGRVFGGVHFDLYEDHRPPEAVRALGVNLVDGKAVLTWDPVLQEAETGLPERVAYYEVLRGGAAVAKVVRDADPYRPGIQWIDPRPVRGSVKYTVRVVDEGGNVSTLSPVAAVTPSFELLNWLTWLLLILIALLLFIVVFLLRRGTQP